MILDILRANLASSLAVHNRLAEACLPSLEQAARALASAYLAGRKALFFGNGGSAADAQHLAAEFVGRYLRDREPWPALALVSNASAVTAIGNDFGYEQVFARQLRALGVPGDCAIGISTSGRSQSVLEGLRTARRLGLFTVGLTGASGGEMTGIADVVICVPSNETPRIQEGHILLGHALCDTVESVLLAEPALCDNVSRS